MVLYIKKKKNSIIGALTATSNYPMCRFSRKQRKCKNIVFIILKNAYSQISISFFVHHNCSSQFIKKLK